MAALQALSAPPRFARVAAVLLLAVAPLAIYARLVHGSFIALDDPGYITSNPQVRDGLSVSACAWACTAFYEANWHPLTWIAHMGDVTLFGLDAGRHHLMNVLLHAVSGLLLLAALRRLSGTFWPSWFAASLFSLHPLRVEAVAWASQRKEVLSGVFFMLALLAYSRYARAPSVGRYLAVLAAAGLGLLCKASAVTLPFLLLLLDFWPLRRYVDVKTDRLCGRRAARLVAEKLPFLALSSAVSALTFLAQRAGGAVAPLETYPIATRIANALVSCAHYAWMFLWPARLSIFYPHPGTGLPVSQVVLAGAGIAATIILFLGPLRSRSHLAVGWLWFLGMLVPTLGLVQVGGQARADRYTYLPAIGLALLLSFSLAELWRCAPKLQPFIAVGAAFQLAALGLASHFQAQVWLDSRSLFEHSLVTRGDNYLAHHGLGNYWLDRKDAERAVFHFKAAIRLHPAHVEAWNGLGIANSLLGRNAEAASAFAEAVRLHPTYAAAHRNLANIRNLMGDSAGAAEHYRKALALRPDYPELNYNLGNLLMREGRLEEAARHYEAELRIDPGSAAAFSNLGVVRARQGDAVTALRLYEVALAAARGAGVERGRKVAELTLGNIAAAAAALLREAEQQGDAAKAREIAQRWLAADPQSGPAHRALVAAEIRLGQPRAARAALASWLKARPEDRTVIGEFEALLGEKAAAGK